MSEIQPTSATFPPVRACIFDVDGLLVNSEDIYTEIYNNILQLFGRPDLPWSIKSKQQSGGRQGMLKLLDWAQLPITYDEWKAKVSAQYDLFKTCTPLPGVPQILSNLSSKTVPPVQIAIASSATSETFTLKTSHLPSITSPFPPDCRVFGDDAAMSEARKKPMPDCFLLALARINAHLGLGEKKVKPEECLVFEDSVAGVEAGRRAGMRVCWVPHKGLWEVWRGREGKVLRGKTGEEGSETGMSSGPDEGEANKKFEEQKHLFSEDGWAEMLSSMEDFDYDYYDIQFEHDKS